MAEPIPRERRRSERNWYWDEVDPKTRTIVGALEAADMPGATKPSLLKMTAGAAIEGFGVTLDYVNETYERSIQGFAEAKGVDYNPDAIGVAIIDGLRSSGPEAAREVLAELGQCASRRSWAAELASQVTDQIFFDNDPYKALPTLEALSTLAMYSLATEKMEGGPVYVASPPGVSA